MADSREPAFDREGKYLYFVASTNAGATSDGLDMTSDLYQVTSNIYAITLAKDTASPIAPELEDEKTAPAEDKARGQEAAMQAIRRAEAQGEPAAETRSRMASLTTGEAGEGRSGGHRARIVALPLPAGVYTGLETGLKGSLYFTEIPDSGTLLQIAMRR